MVSSSEKKARKRLAVKAVLEVWDRIKGEEDVRKTLEHRAKRLGSREHFDCLLNPQDLHDIYTTALEKQRLGSRQSKTSAGVETTVDREKLPPSPPATSDAEGQTDSNRSTTSTATGSEKSSYGEDAAENVMIAVYDSDQSKWEPACGCYGTHKQSYISIVLAQSCGVKVDDGGPRTITLAWREHGWEHSKYPRTKFTIVGNDDIVHDIVISTYWNQPDEQNSDAEASKPREHRQQSLEDDDDTQSDMSEPEYQKWGPSEEDEDEEPFSDRSAPEAGLEQSESEAEACNAQNESDNPESSTLPICVPGLGPGSMEFFTKGLWGLDQQRLETLQQEDLVNNRKVPAPSAPKPIKSKSSKSGKLFTKAQSDSKETLKASRSSQNISSTPKSNTDYKRASQIEQESIPNVSKPKTRRRSSSIHSTNSAELPLKSKHRTSKLPKITQSDTDSSLGETTKLKQRKPGTSTQDRLASEKKMKPRSPISSTHSTKSRRAKSGSSEYG